MDIESSLLVWQPINLRMTVFLSPKVEYNQLKSWQDHIGEAPEESKSQPRTGVLEEFGRYKKGMLEFKKEPGRIDWNYNTILDLTLSKESSSLPTLGSLTEAINDVFNPCMLTWLKESCGSISRLALGGQFILPCNTHREAYQLLDRCLPSVKVDPETSDFSYNINRKRVSLKYDIDELIINRISRWNAIRHSMKIGNVDKGTMFSSVCSLDINTDQDYNNEIPNDYFEKLFYELAEMKKEILDKGDIP